MAYSQPFVLTTIRGVFHPTDYEEMWMTTFKLPVNTQNIPAASEILAFLQDIEPDVKAYHTNTTTGAGGNSQVTELTGAVIGTDGHYLGNGTQETVVHKFLAPGTGTGTNVRSFSAACCISMRTSIARGRGSRGRMYWPARSVPVDTGDGRLTVSQQTAMITNAQTLLNQINSKSATAFGVTSLVSVMSNLGAGTTATVGYVSIGRKLDNMESREGKLSEEHQWTALNTVGGLYAEERRAIEDRWRN